MQDFDLLVDLMYYPVNGLQTPKSETRYEIDLVRASRVGDRKRAKGPPAHVASVSPSAQICIFLYVSRACGVTFFRT